MSILTGRIRGYVVAILCAATLSACAGQSAETSSSTPPPTAPESSAVEQYLTSVREQFQQTAPDAQVPEVDVVRPVGYLEQPALLVGCLDETGFAAEISGPAAAPLVSAEYAPEQAEAYALAMYTCQSQYPVSTELVPVNETTFGEYYDFLVAETAPCLTELGYTIPEPPSRQAFIEESLGGQTTWSPMDMPAQQSQEAWTAAFDACPQNPWMPQAP